MKYFFITTLIVVLGCHIFEVEKKLLAEHTTSKGEKIIVYFVSTGATTEDNIQVRKGIDDNENVVSFYENYDSLMYSKLINDSILQIVIWNSRSYGSEPHTVMVSLNKTLFNAKKYVDSMERRYP